MYIVPVGLGSHAFTFLFSYYVFIIEVLVSIQESWFYFPSLFTGNLCMFDQSFVTLFHCSLSSSLCFLTQNTSITGLKYSQCALSRKCWVISLDCDSNKCFFFNISQIKNSYLQGIQSFTNRAVGKFSVWLTEPN